MEAIADSGCLFLLFFLCLEEYRSILIRLQLEPSFLRHLTELSKLGLIDSDSVYSTLLVLRNRNIDSRQDCERETRFLYAERLEEESAKEEWKNQKKKNT